MESFTAQVADISETFDSLTPVIGSFVLPVAVALTLWVAYVVITKGLRRYVFRHAFTHANSKMFLLLWRYTWLASGALLVILLASGSLTALGLSAAFLGMILGWSLQAPVTGIAAWLMVILKRPFRIGDRIIIDGIIGDVTDISLTHISLNQVGGTVSGEDPSGRGVMVPNGMLFTTKIFNYAFESSYLLDEVAVSVTFGSDLPRAEDILLVSAREVTADFIRETGKEPYTRVKFAPSGVDISLRYQTPATSRQMVSSAISRIIAAKFNEDPSVEFAYPHTQIVFDGQRKEAHRAGS